jgi:hypothetical protein
MNWLNDNGAAVQALASIATVLATLLLAALTARYVDLTKALAEAADRQHRLGVEQVTERQTQARRALTLRALFLYRKLKLLPDYPNTVGLPRNALWMPDDEDKLEEAAHQIGSDEAERAARIRHELGRLREMYAALLELSSGQGTSLRPPTLGEWFVSLSATRNELLRLANVTRDEESQAQLPMLRLPTSD